MRGLARSIRANPGFVAQKKRADGAFLRSIRQLRGNGSPLLTCGERIDRPKEIDVLRVGRSRLVLGVRYVRQALHCSALVVRRKVRVLARDCGALVSDNFARHEVGDTRCFQHRHCAVAQSAE